MYRHTRRRVICAVAIVLILTMSAIAGSTATPVYSVQVPLGAARSFAVLTGAALTGNAPTVINGNVGYGTVITFTGTVNGTTTGPMSAWQTAHDDLVTAYKQALSLLSALAGANELEC